MKKRIVDLSPEEQDKVRAYNRKQKQQSREKQRAAAHIPTANEWFDSFPVRFPEESAGLDAHCKHILKTIQEELPDFPKEYQANSEAEYIVDLVARTLLALKKNWIREVHSPDGLLVGGMYFPDALGSVIVDATHRYSLERSQTFAGLYRELLATLDKRYGLESTYDARAIKAELAREYVFPEPSAERKQEAAIAAKEL
jgi:hypothetical protein